MTIFRFTAALTSLILLGLSSLALASGPADHLADKLDLDEQQATTITALVEEHRDYMANEIQWRDADGNPNPEAREQARAAREALEAEILAVLDADQAEKFEQMKDKRGKHHGRKDRGHSFARALHELDLSEEQQDSIHALMAERKAQRQQEHEQFRSELESILTEEQLAELEAMRDKRRGHRGHH